jgi:5-hydroxyisourate hydrolase
MSLITTHVLDTSVGLPAAGVEVTLERRQAGGAWVQLATGVTDRDGRLKDLPTLPAGRRFEPGTYRLVFQTGAYFAGRKVEPFFPHVEVVFSVTDAAGGAGGGAGRHYHVPLLISPFGYTTYRGS